MAIQEGPDTHNEKAVKTRWPIDEGLIAGTTRQTGERFLHATGLDGGTTNIPCRNREGL